MEIRIVDFGSSAHSETLALRRDVFGDLPFTAEEIEKESGDVHVGLFDGETLVGCLVLTTWSEALLQVRQVSVRAELRRRGLGKAMMDAVESLGRDRGFRLIGLYARDEAVAFYRSLGYRYCDEWPPEAGIPTQMSAKAITLDGL